MHAMKPLFAALALVAATVSLPLYAATPTSSHKQVQAENTNAKFKLGDQAPEVYRQDRQAVTNWQSKGLKEPVKEAQWVQISDKYVLLQKEDGKILDIQPVK